VGYAREGSGPPPYDVRVLLGAAIACATLHVALAALAFARFGTLRATLPGGFWSRYFAGEAVCRTLLTAFLVAGAAAVWTRGRSAARRAVLAALGLIGLGVLELLASTVSFVTGPPRPGHLAGVTLAIGQTLVNRYGLLALLVYVLARPPVRERQESIDMHETAIDGQSGSPTPSGSDGGPVGDCPGPVVSAHVKRPPIVRALLALAFATSLLHLARALLGLANIAVDPRVSWTGGYEAWQFVPMALFATLLPALLVLGVVGLWKRKEGAGRLARLSAGLLVALGALELTYGLIQLVSTPQPPVHAGESLVSLVNAFLANNGVLVLLVVALRRRTT
jgi:hypothetical protein